METTTDKLHLVRPTSPFMAVQINTDIPSRAGYREVMEQVLVNFAEQHPKKVITIYTYISFGIDFGVPAQCLLVGTARSKPLTEELFAALRNYMKDGVHMTYMQVTDEISTEFHLEDGVLWRKDDELYWSCVSSTTDSAVEKNGTDAEDWDDDEESDEDWDEDNENLPQAKNGNTTANRGTKNQCQNLYADDSLTVGELQKNIEDTFGLPPGSVKLMGYKGKIRSDAYISTLRRQWEE